MDETRHRSKRSAAWPPPLDAFQQRVGEMLRASPAGDIERNMKALAAQFFGRLDLVTRDDYDDLLAVVERLTARVAALERAAGIGPGAADAAVRAGPGASGAPRSGPAADPGIGTGASPTGPAAGAAANDPSPGSAPPGSPHRP